MANIIVERSFVAPITKQEIDAIGLRMAGCLDLYRVKWVRSCLSADRRRMICQYEASDAESVRIVQHEADASYDRVWVAEMFGPGAAE